MIQKKSNSKIRTDLPENFFERDLSWLAFNYRVLQEGLDESVPFAERLKFLAITSSNLDEFFKVRVASAHQKLRADRDISENSARKAGVLLEKISEKAHELVSVQSAAIRKALANMETYGLEVTSYAQMNENAKTWLRGCFESEILPILTPMAIEDIHPMPLLPALQLYVALWMKVPSNISNRKSSISENHRKNHAGETSVSVRKTAAKRKAAETKTRSEETEDPENLSVSRSESRRSKTKRMESLSSKKTASGRSRGRKLPQQEQEFEEKLAVIPVPTLISRFVKFYTTTEQTSYAFLEQVIAENADLLFPGCEILSHSVFRITRDEDVPIEDRFQPDFAQEVQNAVLSRKYRDVVRLEISANCAPQIREKIAQLLNLTERDIYELDAPLDATVLHELAGNHRLQDVCYREWKPVDPLDLKDCGDLYERIAQEDVMLFMPYEKFTPVIDLLESAAEDPDVLAIKQTLYRTSGDSPIVKALIKAAQNGKEVSVLVELRARFDESRNLQWTRQLETAGCHVIYGIAGLKTHAKAMLIIRREKGRIRRYVHLSTGNYNDRTARFYSDIALMTSNPEIASDVAAFFNILTGYSESVGWKRLTVEPVHLKRRFLELIDREIALSTPAQPGCILAKVNSLEDPHIIEALYRASQHGVKIRLNVRGICCLRPGVPGLSENIEVTSIIDRFLEHARIFCFHNGGDSEIYLASSDWMTRNLEHRLEIIFPILSKKLKKRIRKILDVFLADNQKSQILHSDGTWTKRPVGKDGKKIRAQEFFHIESVEAANLQTSMPTQYIPLQRPES